MQLLIETEDYVVCPACLTNIAKWFADGYPDYASMLHSKEHIRLNLATPESYNEDIIMWTYPQKPYELYTDLST
jgi:hypothetical protein